MRGTAIPAQPSPRAGCLCQPTQPPCIEGSAGWWGWQRRGRSGGGWAGWGRASGARAECQRRGGAQAPPPSPAHALPTPATPLQPSCPRGRSWWQAWQQAWEAASERCDGHELRGAATPVPAILPCPLAAYLCQPTQPSCHAGSVGRWGWLQARVAGGGWAGRRPLSTAGERCGKLGAGVGGWARLTSCHSWAQPFHPSPATVPRGWQQC